MPYIFNNKHLMHISKHNSSRVNSAPEDISGAELTENLEIAF